MIAVDSSSAGQRLDLWLSSQFPQYSRSAVRKLLDAGKVQINGAVEYRPNYRVQIEDNIEVVDVDELKRQALPAVDFGQLIDIIYQDQDIIVVNKPEGIKVHPTTQYDKDSLLNFLYHQLQGQLSEFGINLVNRIDRETSGLVVCAVSAQGAHHYGNLFANSKAKKKYLAAVNGNWLARHGIEPITDSLFLKYNHLEKRQDVDKQHSLGEYAQTTFRFLDYSSSIKASLVEAQPVTGRTHQIRVHLESLGFPILGDSKYGGQPFERLMLHAHKLMMETPSGETLKLVAPAPATFKSYFHELG